MRKYIVLGNGTGWCFNSWKSSINELGITFINEILPYKGNKLLSFLCFVHYRIRSKYLRILPFTCIWYKHFERRLELDKDAENILIIYDWNFVSRDFAFLNYLRRKYQNIRIVYLYSNIVKASGSEVYHITNYLLKHYDHVFAFDKLDSEKYGFEYSPLIYTTNEARDVNEYKYDLFYIGKAKDRYSQLIEIFEKAKHCGLRTNFNIVGVPEDEQLYKDEIHYKPLKYEDVIKNMIESRCFVDAIQGESSALTIKTCEAVLFGRKLITTNKNVACEPFYHTENILIYPSDISLEKFMDIPIKKYTEEEKLYFSPLSLFKKII